MYRGTKDAIIEIGPEKKGFSWRKLAPNGTVVCVSGDTFEARRYAAVAGHREYPKLRVLHKYGNQRLEHEATDTGKPDGKLKLKSKPKKAKVAKRAKAAPKLKLKSKPKRKVASKPKLKLKKAKKLPHFVPATVGTETL